MRWFRVLFVVDMWERFSFYGMLAILYLYLVAPVAEGGRGFTPGTSAAAVGTYLALTFMAALPGGWVADRVLGQPRAVLVGGVVIACGHYVLALPYGFALVPGLGLIVAGTGLVKPSIAALVGRYSAPERREANMSIFYMSVQISALLAPLVTGVLAVRVSWHAAFAAAAVGMTVGVVLYARGMSTLDDVGPPAGRVSTRQLWSCAGVVAGVLALAAWSAQVLVAVVGLGAIVLPFVVLWRLRGTAPPRSLTWLMLAGALFWGLFAQGGTLLSQFADDSTDRSVLGHVVPASWFQSLSPLFLLLVAPLAAWLWPRLRAAPAVKVAAGLFLAAVAFCLMALASRLAADGTLVTPLWLVIVYLLLACGELAVGPIVLSTATGAAPAGYEGRFVGLSWLFIAMGVVVAAQLARLIDVVPGSAYFAGFGAFAAVVALVLGLRGRRTRAGVGVSRLE